MCLKIRIENGRKHRKRVRRNDPVGVRLQRPLKPQSDCEVIVAVRLGEHCSHVPSQCDGATSRLTEAVPSHYGYNHEKSRTATLHSHCDGHCSRAFSTIRPYGTEHSTRVVRIISIWSTSPDRCHILKLSFSRHQRRHR